MGQPAFLEFYGRNNISPVAQNVADLARHFSCRRHLYHHLGIPPIAMRDRRIVEFGCGSGHNSLYIESLKPRHYALVDGNERGICETAARLRGADEILHSKIEDCRTPEKKFDVVLCEGVIPHQEHPADLARHVASFTAPGGVLVITTADYVSVLSETLRRLIRDTMIDCNAPIDEQLKMLRPIFESHAAHLPGMNRSVDDWIIDTIINPWEHPLFSIEDAIVALGDEFEILGSSPRFLTDWRWYKDLHGSNAQLNAIAIRQYHARGLGLIDCRTEFPPVGKHTQFRVATISRSIFDLMLAAESGHPVDAANIADRCDELFACLLTASWQTGDALKNAAGYFRNRDQLIEFAPWFGRGQQYLSFVRKG